MPPARARYTKPRFHLAAAQKATIRSPTSCVVKANLVLLPADFAHGETMRGADGSAMVSSATVPRKTYGASASVRT